MISLKDYKKCRKIVIEEVFRALEAQKDKRDKLHLSGTHLALLKMVLLTHEPMKQIMTEWELKKKWKETKDVS